MSASPEFHAEFPEFVSAGDILTDLVRTGPASWLSVPGGGSPLRVFARPLISPTISTALISGALLAFALSFDEVIVTTFTAGSQQTLPIWILTNLSRLNQLPIVNVVGVLVIALSTVPVYFAYRLTRDEAVSVPAA